MRKVTFVQIGLFSLVGLVGSASICTPKAFAFTGDGQIIYHQYKAMWHKDVGLPLRNLALDIRDRVNDLLNAILEDDFEIVKKNAIAASNKGNQILETYFPQSLDIEAFKTEPKTSHLQPEVVEKFKNLREEFLSYFSRIDSGLQDIQKAAEARDADAAFEAFSGLIKKTCIECHKKYRH
jgi:cytochrome c556